MERTANCLHLAVAINLPNGSCLTHVHAPNSLLAFCAHSRFSGDESWSSMAWHSTAFVRDAASLLLTGCISLVCHVYVRVCALFMWTVGM